MDTSCNYPIWSLLRIYIYVHINMRDNMWNGDLIEFARLVFKHFLGYHGEIGGFLFPYQPC